MAPLVVPQAVLMRLIWTLAGTPYAINVIGTRKEGSPTINQAFANAIGSTVKSGYTASTLAAQHAPNVALANVGVRDISTPFNAEFLDAGAAVPGTGSGNLLPKQVAACVTLRTAKAGKKFRGRVYLPGFVATANDANGLMTTAAGNAAAGFLVSLIANLPAAGLRLAVVSRVDLSTELVTNAQSRDNQWDTIRGRATPGV